MFEIVKISDFFIYRRDQLDFGLRFSDYKQTINWKISPDIFFFVDKNKSGLLLFIKVIKRCTRINGVRNMLYNLESFGRENGVRKKKILIYLLYIFVGNNIIFAFW